jgi:hypothetical protein
MAVQFKCPTGHTLHAPRGWIGRMIACPICQAATIVPTPKGAKAVAARQAATGFAPQPAGFAAQSLVTRRRGYRAEPILEQSVRWLGGVLAGIAMMSTIPIGWHIFDAPLPGWVWGVVLLAAVELAYVLWMISLPDWSTVWVVTWVFAASCAVYALVLAVALFAPRGDALPLALDTIRPRMAAWSAAVSILQGVGAYLAGRYSVRWRAYCRAMLAN